MQFEDLLKRAFNDNSEPFRDLIEKGGVNWGDVSPSGGIKKKAKAPAVTAATPNPAPAAPAPTKAGKPPKIPVNQTTPAKAGTKTTVQMDSATTPVKQTIVTPDGPQHKTFHEGQGGVPSNKTSLIIPVTDPKTKKTNKVTYKTNKDGSLVAQGHAYNQVPVDIKLDDQGKWYHDNLKVGDHVAFNGWSGDFNQWVPVSSEVTELNPNGEKVAHVKPLHKDAIGDPNAEPLKVHYNKIQHFMRKKEEDPGKWDHFKYPGEYQTPTVTDPEGAKPEPIMSPEQHHQHAEHKAEIVKQKTDSLKTHLEGGDIVEFWMTDPVTNKLTLNVGTAHNMASLTGKPGAGGAKSGAKGKAGKDGETPDINNVVVQTKYGYEDVPLDQVKRFGKYLVDELHMFSFDPENQKWMRDSKSAQEVQPVDQKEEEQGSAQGLPANVPHPSTVMEHPVPTQQALQTSEEKSSAPAIESHMAESQEPSHIIMSAGGKYIDEDPEEGVVFFQDPATKRVHAIPKDEISTQRVLSALGKLPVDHNKEQFNNADSNEQFKKQDIKNHWTHQLPEDLVGHIRGLVDKLDKYASSKDEPMPPSILMARHRLLHDYDGKKAMKNAAQIEEFLQNPNALPKIKPPLQRDDYSKKFNGTKNFDSVSFEDAKTKLGTNRPAHPMLEKKQTQALESLHELAHKNGLSAFSGALGQISTHNDNRNLINFYKMKLEDAIKAKGGKTEAFSLNLPSDQSIEQAHHVNEMNDYLHNNHLMIPAYKKKMDQLNHFVEHSPDSPMVQNLFNQIHHYAYNAGPNDTRFKAFAAESQLDELPKDKYDPKAIGQIKHLLGRISDGEAAVPEDHLMLAHKIAKQHGIPLEEFKDINFNDTAKHTQKLDALMENRKMLEAQKKADQVQQSAESAMQPNEAPKAALPNDPQVQAHNIQLKQKAAMGRLKFLQAREDSYKKVLQQLQDQKITNPDETTAGVLRDLYSNMQRDVSDVEGMRKELAQAGIEIPQFKLDVPPPPGSPEEKTEDSVPDRASQRLSQIYNQHQDKSKMWMENQIGFTHNDIQVLRSHFLSKLNKQLPSVQQDLKEMDAQVGKMLSDQSWKPIDPGSAHTPQGRQFIEMINEKIESLRKREKLTGVTIDEALGKSVGEMITAEKKIARRDVSLALRKAFSNDKTSIEVQKATNLLGSYVDDFIEAVMLTYCHIPLSVRKSITRKLLKSLIADVIKDNEFSAINMQDDFTAPLNDQVIKALGQRIAGFVTEFRMEANPGKQMFVVDIAKSITRSKRIVPKLFSHGHTRLEKSTHYPQEVWSELLIDLEDKLYKAGVLETKISPFRIKKFVADNDVSVLLDFYNEQVNTLDGRLEEIKDGD